MLSENINSLKFYVDKWSKTGVQLDAPTLEYISNLLATFIDDAEALEAAAMSKPAKAAFELSGGCAVIPFPSRGRPRPHRGL